MTTTTSGAWTRPRSTPRSPSRSRGCPVDAGDARPDRDAHAAAAEAYGSDAEAHAAVATLRLPVHDLFQELRLYLEDAADQLGQLEAALPWYLIHGEAESPARGALVDHIRQEFVPGFVRYTELIDGAVRAAAGE